MTDDIDVLSETLQRSRRRVALTADGEPIITANQADKTLSYVHPKTFVDKLKESGKTIHPYSLVISQITEEPKPPETPKTPTVAPPEGTPPEDLKVPEVPEEPKEELWTKKELTAIGDKKNGYRTLQGIAKKTDDVAADGTKANLIKNLTGRPK